LPLLKFQPSYLPVLCYICSILIFLRGGNLGFPFNAKRGASHTVGSPLLTLKYIQTPLHACKGAIPACENPIETDNEIDSVIWVWVCSTHWGDKMRSVHKTLFGEVEGNGARGRPRCR